jgi:hypothetical protein
MAATLEELTYNYEDEGKLVRREKERAVLSRGAWATVMFLYEELDRQTETWRAPKIAIVRFKKSGGVYRKQSSFNISSERQAREIVAVIDRWYGPAKAAGEAEPAETTVEEE